MFILQVHQEISLFNEKRLNHEKYGKRLNALKSKWAKKKKLSMNQFSISNIVQISQTITIKK